MNIELFEGQSCLVHVKLPEDWEVYGGTPKAEFRAERESADSVLVTVPAMEAEFTPLVPYELFARRILDGREWLVLSGQLHVRRRYSDAGGGISPIEYFVEPQLVEDGISSSPQIIVGIPGPQGPKGDKGDPGEGGMTSEERATLAGAAQRGAANTFTASNTFTGSVDMSTAQVTPPSGWNVGELTAEEVKAVVPMAWGSFAKAPYAGAGGVTFGSYSYGGGNSVAIGTGASSGSLSPSGVAVGYQSKASYGNAIAIGLQFDEVINGTRYTRECQTQGTGSITIGAGANTKNNGDVESSNSVTIGCKASNKGADSVVIGAQAKVTNSGSVAFGVRSESGISSNSVGSGATSGQYSVSFGTNSTSFDFGVAIGAGTLAKNENTAIGSYSNANARRATAIGYAATVSDYGATVIRSTAQDGTYTQLYFSGANTPLANTYHDGAPMLGYVTKDSAGNIVAAGTRSLIDLLTANSTFAPASLDENGEWVMPKVFHPSDLDMPSEEPSEPEEYTPLPVYPIVEPSDIFGDNGTLEQGDTENTSPATKS